MLIQKKKKVNVIKKVLQWGQFGGNINLKGIFYIKYVIEI